MSTAAQPTTITIHHPNGSLRELDILRTMVEAADVGLLVVSPNSQALACNERFLQIWNIPPEISSDNGRMMDHVLDQLVDQATFVDRILEVNSDPAASSKDEVHFKDGRVIERSSEPCNRPDTEIHRVWRFRDITAHKQAEQELRTQQQLAEERQNHIIEMQASILAELSTPLLPISDDLLVMPLIGAVDSSRAQLIMDALLDGVSTYRPKAVIIDITGVSVVDTQVANSIVQCASAVRLLGASAILTGIRPPVAQTIVGLGVSFQGIKTFGTLQVAIATMLGGAR